MLCENCNKSEATIHYTEIVNGMTTEHHLCSGCAKELDLSYYSNVLNSEIPFAKLLTGLLASGVMKNHDSPMSHVLCPKCSMNYQEFVRVGKFGCEECYNVFGPLIEEHLKKLHGNTVNAGKKYNAEVTEVEIDVDSKMKPSRQTKQSKKDSAKEIELLTAKLNEAVRLENFEDAVKYRDLIKSMKERDEADA